MVCKPKDLSSIHHRDMPLSDSLEERRTAFEWCAQFPRYQNV